MSLTREQLIEEGVKLNLDRHTLEVSPEWTIRELIASEEEKQKRRGSTPSKTAPSLVPNLSESTTLPAASETGGDAPEDSGEDNETVVNISYAVKAANPVERNHNRHQELMMMQQELVAAIRTNSMHLDANRAGLHPDDVAVIEADTHLNQTNLKLVMKEIRQIEQYFRDEAQQRISFYQKFRTGLHDVSGNLQRHFDSKVESYNKYMHDLQNCNTNS